MTAVPVREPAWSMPRNAISRGYSCAERRWRTKSWISRASSGPGVAPGRRTDPVDVVDIDRTNDEATIFGDLCDPATLAGITADAVILTQTLQYLSDPSAGLRHLFACLRPGGALLITVPCLQRELLFQTLLQLFPPPAEQLVVLYHPGLNRSLMRRQR